MVRSRERLVAEDIERSTSKMSAMLQQCDIVSMHAVLMLIAAAGALWLGIAAERKPLEEVAPPLSFAAEEHEQAPR